MATAVQIVLTYSVLTELHGDEFSTVWCVDVGDAGGVVDG